ncbi:hypothetical protein [Nocardiopsis sp. NRRL B-16309]|nr:hypothetical protein [Nocardiopsis sp. NRRL B-16309]
MVNGCTGAVEGERPYSSVKVSATALAVVTAMLAVILFALWVL